MSGLILPYRGVMPKIDDDVFIAPNASVIGDVEIGPRTNLWFGVLVRGDVNIVRIGEHTNLQDGTIVHVDSVEYGTFIGSNVTIGHGATVHACTLGDWCFVGMNATVMDGAVVEDGAMVAAGALVAPGKRVKSGELWAGVPARFLRPVNAAEQELIDIVPGHYWGLAKEYMEAGIGQR